MSRKKKSQKRIIVQDPIYNSVLVSKMINKILLKGKKTLAQHIFYEVMENLKETYKQNPLDILKKAVENATPSIEVRPKRVGGAIYQVPTEVKKERGNNLALRFIVTEARERPGKSMITKLENEIIDAYNNTGNAIKKKDDIQKKAESNKAFSNIRF